MRRRFVLVVVAALCGAVVVAGGPAARAATFPVEVMPGDHHYAGAAVVYDDGVVAGDFDRTFFSGPFVWDSDGVHAINDRFNFFDRSVSGLISGSVVHDDGRHLAVWDRTDGVRFDPTPHSIAMPAGFVGDTIVGNIFDVGNGDAYHAVSWVPGSAPVALPDLGGTTARADVSDGKYVAAGVATDPAGTTHLVRWINGAIEDLGIVPGIIAGTENLRVARVGVDGSLYASAASNVAGPPGALNRQVIATWHPPTAGVASSTTTTVLPPNTAVTLVNRRGQWVGRTCTSMVSGFCFSAEAIRLDADGAVSSLLVGHNAAVVAIDDRGRILIDDYSPDRPPAILLWQPDCGLTELDRGGRLTIESMNSSGLVAGYQTDPAGGTAYKAQLHLEPCTPDAQTPAAPAPTAALSWKPVDGRDGSVTHYRVYRDGSPVADVAGSATRFDDANAGVGTHTYAVSAINTYGESQHSANVTAEVTAEPQGQPAALTPTAATPIAANPPFTG